MNKLTTCEESIALFAEEIRKALDANNIDKAREYACISLMNPNIEDQKKARNLVEMLFRASKEQLEDVLDYVTFLAILHKRLDATFCDVEDVCEDLDEVDDDFDEQYADDFEDDAEDNFGDTYNITINVNLQ